MIFDQQSCEGLQALGIARSLGSRAANPMEALTAELKSKMFL